MSVFGWESKLKSIEVAPINFNVGYVPSGFVVLEVVSSTPQHQHHWGGYLPSVYEAYSNGLLILHIR